MLESLSSLQMSLAAVGGLTVVAVVIYNHWTSRKNEPRQADPVLEAKTSDMEPVLNTELAISPSHGNEPLLDDGFANLPMPERKTQLDALIDVIALIEVDQAVSGDAALAALPTTRRVGSKLFMVEGLSQETGLWDGLLGEAVPAEGNPELALKLIADSGEAFPQPFVIDYAQSETNDKAAASLVASLAKGGIVATLNPLEPGGYYGVVLDPEKQGSMSAGGWGPDWSNASTVVPELFAANGGFNLSQWDDEAFLAESEAAKVITDRAEQAKAWQALSKKSMELGLALPTRFGKEQRIHGSKVSGAYIWGPYGSWPYAALSVN
jgi:hypothetical protein